jgi:hypothetical protein
LLEKTELNKFSSSVFQSRSCLIFNEEKNKNIFLNLLCSLSALLHTFYFKNWFFRVFKIHFSFVFFLINQWLFENYSSLEKEKSFFSMINENHGKINLFVIVYFEQKWRHVSSVFMSLWNFSFRIHIRVYSLQIFFPITFNQWPKY